MIAEDHFEQHLLERERQYPYEDGYREPAETDFHEKAYAVWNECGSEFYGRTTGLERAEVPRVLFLGICLDFYYFL